MQLSPRPPCIPSTLYASGLVRIGIVLRKAFCTNQRLLTVTGSSQGLGRSLVDHLLANSQRVVATARNVNTLDEFRQKYSSDQLLCLRLDVTKPEEIDEVFAKTEEHFHRLDVVINNAGYGVNGEIEGTPDDVARGELETLFWGPVNIMKQVRRHLKHIGIFAHQSLSNPGCPILPGSQPTRPWRSHIQHELRRGVHWSYRHRVLFRREIWCVLRLTYIFRFLIFYTPQLWKGCRRP